MDFCTGRSHRQFTICHWGYQFAGDFIGLFTLGRVCLHRVYKSPGRMGPRLEVTRVQDLTKGLFWWWRLPGSLNSLSDHHRSSRFLLGAHSTQIGCAAVEGKGLALRSLCSDYTDPSVRHFCVALILFPVE